MHGSFVVLIVLQAVPCIVIICIIVNPCLGQWGRAWGSSIGTPIGNIALVWVVISMFRRYNASPHIQVAAEIVGGFTVIPNVSVPSIVPASSVSWVLADGPTTSHNSWDNLSRLWPENQGLSWFYTL